ncbi:MAG: radical SAM protein [Halobacteriota archaeon]|nr:radical SAM protein [Halobacteriota archaeon]
MDVISIFDPWDDPLCTCPVKYSLNPYTGCSHGCIYCYITSYIPRAFDCRPKKDLLRRVERDMRKVEKIPISMSNSSDPYPPMEKELLLTRDVLKMIQRHQHPLLIATKSDLVARDIGILKRMNVAVTITITTFDPIYKKTEPKAPSPEKRLKAMKILAAEGVPVGLRLDPLIPGLNKDFKEVIKYAASAGASHVVASTLKPRPDGWNRIKKTFPELSKKLAPQYFEEGEVHSSSRYLPEDMRREILGAVKEETEMMGMTFATCREGLFMNRSVSCDGSHLLDDT